MKIFDPKLTGSIEILNTISGNVTIAGGLTVEGSLGGSATTASYVEYSDIANKPTLISSSAQIASDISGSITSVSSSLASRISSNEGSVDSLNQASSSYALKTGISGSFTSVSSSLASRISLNEGSVDSLNQASSSYLLNTSDTLTGNLTVTGTITAQEFHTEFVSASILYDSGSTKFGNSADDVHSMTGSLQVSGSSHYILGKVGIGTTSPGYQLETAGTIRSTGIGNSPSTGKGIEMRFVSDIGSIISIDRADTYLPLRLEGSTIDLRESGNTVLYVDGGNVGIGTTSPSSRLQIDKSSQTIGGTTPNGALLVSSLTAGNAILEIGVDPTSLSYLQCRNITSTTPYQLLLNPDGGNIGIGTTSPSVKLHTVGDGLFYSNTNTNLTVNSNGGVATLTLTNGAGSQLIYGGVGGSNNMDFYTGGSFRMRIDPSGNVGIGTTSPNAKLQVTKGSSGNVASFTSDATSINEYSGITIHSQTISGDDWYGSEIRSINTAGNPNFLNPRLGFFTQDYSTYLPAGRTEKMSILGNGNVGIGTTSPNKRLQINHDVNDWVVGIKNYGVDAYGLQIDLSGSTGGQLGYALAAYTQAGTGMFVRNDGKVGIGTTSPSQKLTVQGTGATTLLNARNTSAGQYSEMQLQAYDTSYFIFKASSGYSSYGGASFVNYYNQGGGHAFHTDAGNNLLYITNAGNVGIGTTSPSRKLEVYAVNPAFALKSSTSTGYSELYFADSDSDNIGFISYSHSNNELAVGTNGSARMRIDASGNVGIGTTSPGSKLDVSGTTGAIFRYDSSSTYLSLLPEDADGNPKIKFGANGGAAPDLRFINDGNSEIVRFRNSGGITFNGDTAAANALDDYEEGTWTPTLPNGGTLVIQSARYVKIGQQVTVSLYVTSVNPTFNTSEFRIGGLPFANGSYNLYYGGSFGWVGGSNLNSWLPITGGTLNYIYFNDGNGNDPSQTKTNANYVTVQGDVSEIVLTMTYFAAT